MRDAERGQILEAVAQVDGAIDVITAMTPPWHTEDEYIPGMGQPLQCLKTAREMLKLLTMQD